MDITRADPTFSQWTELLELLHAAFAYQKARIDPPSSLYKLDAQSLAHKAKEEVLFLALDEGVLVGCAFAKVRPDCVYVGKFAVRPPCQGQGVGRLLMQAVETFARGTGSSVMELETRIELVENHKTFSAFGFVKTAEHAHAGHDRATFITMQKPLNRPAESHCHVHPA
jgi:GNAT superfamily N-acetyltransferase